MSTLLTIDEQKVREELETVTKPEFVVTISQVGAIERVDTPLPSFVVSGTVPFNLTERASEARKRLSMLRTRIVDSGFQLKSANELDQEIEAAKNR